MRSKPAPPEILRKPFRDLRHRQPAGVGGHNRRQGDYIGELSSAFEEIDGTPKGGLLKSAEETQGDFAIAYTISETPRR